MKPIRSLTEPPSGLADYLATKLDGPDWTEFRSHGSGGSSRRFGPDRRLHDPDRHLAPLRDNLSCGQAKGNKSVTDAIDPRTLPEEPVFVVRSDGRLEVVDEARETPGVRADRATHTLEALGLNVERLRMARRRHWNDLAEESGAIGDEAR